MKDYLIKNYNLHDSIEVVEEENCCSFLFNDKKYYFVPYYRSENELGELIELNNELLMKNIPTSIFIPNRYNQYITNILDKKYILFESPLNICQEYNVLDMVEYANKLQISKKNSILYRNSWAELWSKKVDYLEYQMAQLGKDKPVLLNSFSYYVGLAENAIAYVNQTIKRYPLSNYETITLQRKRIQFPNIQLNYFNPLNYIIDIEVRDIASYFKSMFFKDPDELWIEVEAYLKRKRLSIFGYQLLYARLLYPSYYIDIYEQIMEGNKDENELLPIIEKAHDYELFLKKIYFEIVKYAPIARVDWIANKKES